jgi:hypothetical protein
MKVGLPQKGTLKKKGEVLSHLKVTPAYNTRDGRETHFQFMLLMI